MDAAFLQKPSIVFTKTIFSELSSVFQLNGISNLSELILTAIKSKVNLIDLNKLAAKSNYNSFGNQENNFYYLNFDILEKLNNSGFTSNFSISDVDMKKYYDEKIQFFDIIADEFIKKFN